MRGALTDEARALDRLTDQRVAEIRLAERAFAHEEPADVLGRELRREAHAIRLACARDAGGGSTRGTPSIPRHVDAQQLDRCAKRVDARRLGGARRTEQTATKRRGGRLRPRRRRLRVDAASRRTAAHQREDGGIRRRCWRGSRPCRPFFTEELVVDALDVGDDGGEVVRRARGHPVVSAHAGAELGVCRHREERAGERFRVAHGHLHAPRGVLHDLAAAAHVGREEGFAHRGALDQDARQALAPRRERDDVARRVELGHVGALAEEQHARALRRLERLLGHAEASIGVGRARDGEAHARVLRVRALVRLEELDEALLLDDAAGREEQHVAVADAELRAEGAPLFHEARLVELRQIDAVADELDVARVRGAGRDERVAILAGLDEQAIDARARGALEGGGGPAHAPRRLDREDHAVVRVQDHRHARRRRDEAREDAGLRVVRVNDVEPLLAKAAIEPGDLGRACARGIDGARYPVREPLHALARDDLDARPRRADAEHHPAPREDRPEVRERQAEPHVARPHRARAESPSAQRIAGAAGQWMTVTQPRRICTSAP